MKEITYRVRLIKDRPPNIAGEMYGPINLDGYKSLYENGYINDVLNLIQAQPKKSTKKKKTETETEEENNSNN
jgi:hypothetical protein